MYGWNNYKESPFKSQAGIPRKVKLGPYIFPMLVMNKSYPYFSSVELNTKMVDLLVLQRNDCIQS
jgi:hypothetical protein